MHNAVEWIKNLEPLTLDVIMSVIVSISRMIYDNETSFKRGVSEVVLCTSFTFIGGYSLLLIGLDPKWCIAIGGTIGGLGNITIRSLVKKFINQKAAD